jgi:hypothetical protein
MISKCVAWLTPKPSLLFPSNTNKLFINSWRSFHAVNLQRVFAPSFHAVNLQRASALAFTRQNRLSCPVFPRANVSDVKSNAKVSSESMAWTSGIAIGSTASVLCRPGLTDGTAMGRRGMAKKSRVTQKPKESVNSPDLLEHGVEKVIFSCPSPNQFRVLSMLSGTQLLFWMG